jgi:hypothetical protein
LPLFTGGLGDEYVNCLIYDPLAKMIILGGNTTSANFAPTENDHAWLVGLDLDGNWMWGKFFYNVSYALTTISGCHLSSDGLSINLFGVGNNVPVIMDINSKNGAINKFLHIEYT